MRPSTRRNGNEMIWWMLGQLIEASDKGTIQIVGNGDGEEGRNKREAQQKEKKGYFFGER